MCFVGFLGSSCRQGSYTSQRIDRPWVCIHFKQREGKNDTVDGICTIPDRVEGKGRSFIDTERG